MDIDRQNYKLAHQYVHTHPSRIGKIQVSERNRQKVRTVRNDRTDLICVVDEQTNTQRERVKQWTESEKTEAEASCDPD